MILCGSVHSKRGYANYCAYQTTKGGLLSLTRSLAADFAPKIRVNCLLPGAFITGLWDDVPPDVIEHSAKFCAMQRNGKLSEIADAALFLASDMSSFMTGTDLLVDGGLIQGRVENVDDLVVSHGRDSLGPFGWIRAPLPRWSGHS